MSQIQPLKRAIMSARAGNAVLARTFLQQAAEQAPDDPEVWLWMAWLADSPFSMIQCLEMASEGEQCRAAAEAGLLFARTLAGIAVSPTVPVTPIAELPVADLSPLAGSETSPGEPVVSAVAEPFVAAVVAPVAESSVGPDADCEVSDWDVEDEILPAMPDAFDPAVAAESAETATPKSRQSALDSDRSPLDFLPVADDDAADEAAAWESFANSLNDVSVELAASREAVESVWTESEVTEPASSDALLAELAQATAESGPAENETADLDSWRTNWHSTPRSAGAVSAQVIDAPAVPDRSVPDRSVSIEFDGGRPDDWFAVPVDSKPSEHGVSLELLEANRSLPTLQDSAEERDDFYEAVEFPTAGTTAGPNTTAGLNTTADPGKVPAISVVSERNSSESRVVPPPVQERPRTAPALKPVWRPAQADWFSVGTGSASDANSVDDDWSRPASPSLPSSVPLPPQRPAASERSVAGPAFAPGDPSAQHAAPVSVRYVPPPPFGRRAQTTGSPAAVPVTAEPIPVIPQQCEQPASPERIPSWAETAGSEAFDGRSPAGAAPEVPAAGTNQPTILVVDDSPTIRKLVAMTLEKRGYRVVAAFDGVAAIKEIAAHNPSLILMDVNMPRLDGYQLCKLVKKHDSTRHIPVLMLTGKDGMFDRLRGRLVGCSGYVTKPFVPELLIETVDQYLLPAGKA